MKSFDTLVIIFVIINIVAVIIKRLRQKRLEQDQKERQKRFVGVERGNDQDQKQVDFVGEKGQPPRPRNKTGIPWLDVLADVDIGEVDDEGEGTFLEAEGSVPEERTVSPSTMSGSVGSQLDQELEVAMAPQGGEEASIRDRRATQRRYEIKVQERTRTRLWRGKKDIRRAFLLKEILGPPAADRPWE